MIATTTSDHAPRPGPVNSPAPITELGERASVSTEITLVTPFLVLLLVFVAVFIHRGVDARLRVDDVAHQAARAASLARTADAAVATATQTADIALTDAGVDCPRHDITVDTSDFQPGGIVTVTLTCHVDLTQAALLLSTRSSRDVSATASSPVDTWRATALPFQLVWDRSVGVSA